MKNHILWALGALLLILNGCNGGGLLGANGDINRNVDVSLDLGSAATLRDRVITVNATIRPDSFASDVAGAREAYRVMLEYSINNENSFQPATLFLAPGITVSDAISFPVGSASPFTLKWDREVDLTQEVESRVYLRLTAIQEGSGTGSGSATKGPKEIDLRATGGCGGKTPRIKTSSFLLSRNQTADVPIPVDFGVAPFVFTVNEPLPHGLTLTSDGRITGTPVGPMAPILRLVTVTDSCLQRRDQAWVTIAVP